MPIINIWIQHPEIQDLPDCTDNKLDIGFYIELEGDDEPAAGAVKYSFDKVRINWDGCGNSGYEDCSDENGSPVSIELPYPNSYGYYSITARLFYYQTSAEKDGDNYKWGKSTWAWTDNITTLRYYPCPDSFQFNILREDGKWEVSKGIDKLIPNIKQYSAMASMKKAHEEQSSVSQCPSLFDSQKRMSASQINSIYRYLTGTAANYKKGDPVSRTLLHGLEDILNE